MNNITSLVIGLCLLTLSGCASIKKAYDGVAESVTTIIDCFKKGELNGCQSPKDQVPPTKPEKETP